MNPYTRTDEAGEVFTATFHKANNGWYVDKNGSSHVFIPYSRSFDIDGLSFMATVDAEALRLGRMLINREAEAFAQFEKNHPELNP